MKLFRIIAIAAMAMLSSLSAQAGVVLFSNMGDSGLDNTSGNTSGDINLTNWHASGFETGSAAHELKRASFVFENLVGFTVGTRTVKIYANSVDNPESGSAEYTSNGAFVGEKGVYTFEFAAGTILEANTRYWIVPEAGVKWFMSSTDELPSQRNSSGYTFVGTRETQNSGVNWDDTGGNGFTLSLAVPEPALTSFLCFGGSALIRRRRKK